LGAALLSRTHTVRHFRAINGALFVLAVPLMFSIVAALLVSREPRNTSAGR
jgi:hypothetical protein